jgi:hypothetical protein
MTYVESCRSYWGLYTQVHSKEEWIECPDKSPIIRKYLTPFQQHSNGLSK